MLAHVIRLILRDGADPYLVIGVLLEGVSLCSRRAHPAGTAG